MKPKTPSKFLEMLRLRRKFRRLMKQPGFHPVYIEHDEGCPGLEQQSMLACTCKPNVRFSELTDPAEQAAEIMSVVHPEKHDA